MFKLIPNPTFTVDVNLSVPDGASTGTVKMTFRHQRRKALDAWIRMPQEAAEKGAELLDVDYLGNQIVSWEGVQDEDGTPVEFTKQTFAGFLDSYPAAGREIFEVYVKSLTESRAKN